MKNVKEIALLINLDSDPGEVDTEFNNKVLYILRPHKSSLWYIPSIATAGSPATEMGYDPSINCFLDPHAKNTYKEDFQEIANDLSLLKIDYSLPGYGSLDFKIYLTYEDDEEKEILCPFCVDWKKLDEIIKFSLKYLPSDFILDCDGNRLNAREIISNLIISK